ncbi:MAG: hypothetical protein J5663_03980 [Bacteroidaceae bacterium]|nr:hypothetical protein [Bacteroidaceae bacterium]
MAILNGMLRKMKGSAGSLTFKTVKGQTVVSEKVTEVKNSRTSAQQKHRMKWGNIIQMYKGIAPLLNYGFESKPNNMSDYNMFVKINMQQTPVYISKDMVVGGACIVAPYQITQGSLPAIVATGEGANRVTDIALGGLSITASTTVAEFSNAVVLNNDNYNYGDQISFFNILQKVNASTQIPFGVFAASSVVLDKKNNSTLWSLVHSVGFASKSGFLGHGASDGDGAYCWVHSRKSNGKTLVSTQSLLDNNPTLALYTDEDAYYKSVKTYGGESDVFLSPDGEADSSHVPSNTPQGGGNTGGGGNDDGSF